MLGGTISLTYSELTCRMKLEYRSVMGVALALEGPSPSVTPREEAGSGGGAGWPS